MAKHIHWILLCSQETVILIIVLIHEILLCDSLFSGNGLLSVVISFLNVAMKQNLYQESKLLM